MQCADSENDLINSKFLQTDNKTAQQTWEITVNLYAFQYFF